METVLFHQIDEYLSFLRSEEHSRQTICKYRHDIRCFVQYLRGGQSITKEVVLQYKEMLGRKYKITSANSMLVALNGFLSYLGLAHCRVKLYKCQRQTFRNQARELTRQEYTRLVKAAQLQKKERLSLLIQTICCTGIRVSEHQFVTVEGVREGMIQITNKGKTRAIILPRELCRVLLAHCARRRIMTGPVFVTRSGRPMNRTNIWHEMKNLCRAAKVAPDKVFPHNLRHLFAVCFYQLEKDVVRLADILGHSSIETTRIYTLKSSEEHARTLSRLHLLI